MPASTSALSNNLPAGPTNGLPAKSSSLPGCSPTKITFALLEPSPNTVCVPVFHNGQARHSFAASCNFVIVGRDGTNGAALSTTPPSRLRTKCLSTKRGFTLNAEFRSMENQVGAFTLKEQLETARMPSDG